MPQASEDDVRNMAGVDDSIPSETILAYLADASDQLTDQGISEGHRSYAVLQKYWCLHLLSAAGLFNSVVGEHVADVQTNYVASPDADARFGTSWAKLFWQKVWGINGSTPRIQS